MPTVTLLRVRGERGTRGTGNAITYRKAESMESRKCWHKVIGTLVV